MKTHELIYEMQQTAGVFGRKKEVTLTFEGDGAHTDGEEIVLPALPDAMDMSTDDAMVMRGYLDHEAGHIRHTDFEVFQEFRKHNSDQCGAIHNCLEDMWLEKRVMEEYPGSEKNLRKLTETVGVVEKANILANPDVYNNVTADAVCNAILRAGRLSYGGEITKELFNNMPPKFQEWGVKWAEMAHNAKNTKELCNLAIEIEKLLEATPPSEGMSKPTPKDGEGKGEAGEGLGGNPAEFEFDPNGDVKNGKPARGDGGEGEGKPKDGKGKEMLTESLNKFAEKWLHSKTEQFIKETGNNSKKYTVLSTSADEVYYRNKPAKRKHAVHDLMQKKTPVDYEKIKGDLGGLINTMKARLFRALQARENRDWDYARETGRLDSKRLTAGVLGAPNVYKVRKERLEVDTAVHFLVDLSGSMGGRKEKTAAKAVVALAECLAGTQIQFQISGFNNCGLTYRLRKLYDKASMSKRGYERVEPLNLFVFKGFGDNLQQAKGAIAALSDAAGGNNSDRDAVLWAANELKYRPEKRKILFVLSDGQPANATINSNTNLTQALRFAIDDISKTSVECVGIGICDSTVKSIYPKSVSIDKVEDLAGAVFTQLSNLLTGGKVVF